MIERKRYFSVPQDVVTLHQIPTKRREQITLNSEEENNRKKICLLIPQKSLTVLHVPTKRQYIKLGEVCETRANLNIFVSKGKHKQNSSWYIE